LILKSKCPIEWALINFYRLFLLDAVALDLLDLDLDADLDADLDVDLDLDLEDLDAAAFLRFASILLISPLFVNYYTN